MISSQGLEKLITRLALIPFFPGKDEERIEISDLVEEFAETDEQVDWLGRRMIALYTEWPGPREMRACFCSRYKPKDGISVFSKNYVDGIPYEHPVALLVLPPGREELVSQDPELAAAVARAAEVMAMPLVSAQRRRFLKELESANQPDNISAVSKPTPQVIQPEDIERAVAANQERKAKGVAEYWRRNPNGDDSSTLAG